MLHILEATWILWETTYVTGNTEKNRIETEHVNYHSDTINTKLTI